MSNIDHAFRAILTVVATALFAASSAFAQLFEAHYVFRGGYPIADTPWCSNVEGVAHDDDNWYFTTSSTRLGALMTIWKIPVELDLLTVTATTPGVIRRQIQSTHPLVSHNYEYLGDPDVYRHNGTDYLAVPISGIGSCTTSPSGGMAFFRCSDLSYIDHAELPGQCGDAAWVAVNGAGVLYSSRDHVGLPDPPRWGLRLYTVDWNQLQANGEAIIAFDHSIPMLNESGDPLELVHMQGGDFAPGEQLLYLSSGSTLDDNDAADREGIHVIDTTTFQRVRHSTRGVAGQLFDFYYNPGDNESPEGLTLWDLDNGRAPGIRGQLHVLVSENFHDTVDFKHYTRALAVDSLWSGCHTGAPTCPFQTIPAALNVAWDGAEIRMRGGSYPDRRIISQRVRLNSENGTARIGG